MEKKSFIQVGDNLKDYLKDKGKKGESFEQIIIRLLGLKFINGKYSRV